jgi:hypothetical protein
MNTADTITNAINAIHAVDQQAAESQRSASQARAAALCVELTPTIDAAAAQVDELRALVAKHAGLLDRLSFVSDTTGRIPGLTKTERYRFFSLRDSARQFVSGTLPHAEGIVTEARAFLDKVHKLSESDARSEMGYLRRTLAYIGDYASAFARDIDDLHGLLARIAEQAPPAPVAVKKAVRG